MTLTLNQRQRIAARPIARPFTSPPPIKGWNTRDTLDGMDPQNAIVLDNWFIDGAGVKARLGCATFATGLGASPVETLAEYYSGATRKLLGACAGSIFNVSAGGAVGAALASGFASNRWQTAMFNGKQFWVNGTDTEQTFDGTAFAGSGWTGPAAKLKGVCIFKNRPYFWEPSNTGFWYPAIINAVTGALTFFPLSTVAESGGNVMLITSMSMDGGDGPQEYLCIVMTSGEFIFYQGTDPGSSLTFALMGRYMLAAPVNVRAVCRYGADSYITVSDDHIQLSQALTALKAGTKPPRSEASGAVGTAANNGGDALFGWQALYYRHGNRMMFNVPNSDGTFYQHIYNVQQQAWSRFTGMNASCWSLFAEKLYYGGAAGTVYQADTGATDEGGFIALDAQQAWQDFGVPARKLVTAVRPVIFTSAAQTINVGIGYNFADPQVPLVNITPPTGSAWDTSPWDTSPWSGEAVANTEWHVAGGAGTEISIRLRGNVKETITWASTQYRYQTGNAL